MNENISEYANLRDESLQNAIEDRYNNLSMYHAAAN
jgi:hypothetical protein